VSINPETKSYEDVEAAQARLDDAGLGHWKVTPMHGTEHDPLAMFRAERVAPNGKREIAHREARVLVRLAREADSRIPDDSPVAVSTGTTDTSTHGGA
jgi:hypothetical protein